MERNILNLLRRPNYTPLNAAELRAKLGLARNQQRELERVLGQLERRGQIARVKQGDRYALPLDADLVPGRIRMNRQGVGFLDPDDPKISELRVPADATATAMHGDHVLVRRDTVPRRKRGDLKEAGGRVVRVLESARTQLVGLRMEALDQPGDRVQQLEVARDLGVDLRPQDLPRADPGAPVPGAGSWPSLCGHKSADSREGD